jgi:ADP-heptose:LPS heptosyltransferase
MRRTALVVRLDSAGDVLLAGPAIRAIAAGADVTLLCSSVGRAAAELLPGVRRVLRFDAPWVHGEPPPARRREVVRLLWEVRRHRVGEAVILTSSFQSCIPTALLLRLAGIRRITGTSDDYPGSLLDTRVRVPAEMHEVQRNLAVAAGAGYPGDDRLQLVDGLPDGPRPDGRYVVVHPGADARSRGIDGPLGRGIVHALAQAGLRPVVTGAPSETRLTREVAGSHGVDLGGRTSLAELAGLIAGAESVVVGNTGPAHLAASVGTPVVSLFAPVVPWQKWAPYGVPVVRLGDQDAACADTRARECPVPGHPCLAGVTPDDVVAALSQVCEVAA